MTIRWVCDDEVPGRQEPGAAREAGHRGRLLRGAVGLLRRVGDESTRSVDGHVVTVQRQLRDVRGGSGLGEGSKEVSTGLLIYCTFTVCACLLTS